MRYLHVPGWAETRFKVLVADPAWKFDDPLPGSRGAAANYEVMSVWEVCAMRVPRMSRNAYLFLWRVASQVEEAYQVVRAWGFAPTAELVWQKTTKNGKAWFGMGRTVRNAHETCVIARRGDPKPIDLSVRSRFTAPVPVGPDGKYVHSAKPEKFYRIVERLARGPYAEMFARRRRDGWAQHGNELPPAVEAAG